MLVACKSVIEPLSSTTLSLRDWWVAQKSAAPCPLVASSAARLQTPRVAWLLQPHCDGGIQSHVEVGRW